MKLITGELWNYFGRDNFIILITTNSVVRKNHKAVMGRGCAAEAVQKIPGIEKTARRSPEAFGNKLMLTDRGFGTFPVKDKWWEKADLKLIAQSAADLVKMCNHPATSPTKPLCSVDQVAGTVGFNGMKYARSCRRRASLTTS